jgi:hypothetical protein
VKKVGEKVGRERKAEEGGERECERERGKVIFKGNDKIPETPQIPIAQAWKASARTGAATKTAKPTETCFAPDVEVAVAPELVLVAPDVALEAVEPERLATMEDWTIVTLLIAEETLERMLE